MLWPNLTSLVFFSSCFLLLSSSSFFQRFYILFLTFFLLGPFKIGDGELDSQACLLGPCAVAVYCDRGLCLCRVTCAICEICADRHAVPILAPTSHHPPPTYHPPSTHLPPASHLPLPDTRHPPPTHCPHTPHPPHTHGAPHTHHTHRPSACSTRAFGSGLRWC